MTEESTVLSDESANGNGVLHNYPIHLEPMPEQSTISRIWSKLVVKKDLEGRYSISQPLAIAVLGFILLFGGTWYWRSSDKIQEQHDEIIRLQAKLDSEKEKNADQDSKIDQARNYATKAVNDQAHLEGRFEEFSQIYSVSNPKPRAAKESQ